MRRSWPANLIAMTVVSVTIGVGALGALGSPKANGEAGRTSRGSSQPVAASEPSIPECRGELSSGPLTFTCPGAWFVWQNTTYADDPYASALAIISNRRPLEQGPGEGLPDGWFKIDMYVAPRDPHLTFERLAKEPCPSTDDVTLESCEIVTIGGRQWQQKIERDPFTEYRSIATVVDGVEIHVVAIIPDGPHASEGAREIDALFRSLSIR